MMVLEPKQKRAGANFMDMLVTLINEIHLTKCAICDNPAPCARQNAAQKYLLALRRSGKAKHWWALVVRF